MRQTRLLKQNAVYHVTARINRGEMVFKEAAMRYLFMAYIKRLKEKHSFAIYNFSIMGNHIHFVIRPDKDSTLSKIMQWLLGNYAKAWNKAHGAKGHLWGDRFYSNIISGRDSFLRVFRYISQNPVDAGLVASAQEWEDSGVSHFLKGEPGILNLPPWVKAIYQVLL
jgi:REP element-mobilizing transposase RayT